MLLSTCPPADSAGNFYVIVTGANSGLGYSLCTRLIDNFLLTRPAPQILVLIPTVRSRSKAADTKARLDTYVASLAAGKKSHLPHLVPRPSSIGATHHPSRSLNHISDRALWPNRIIIATPAVFDLCSLTQIHVATRLLREQYQRIDVVVCNAGMGGWTGLDWWGLARQAWEEGFMAALGAPNYKICRAGALAMRQIAVVGKEKGQKDEEDEEDEEEKEADKVGEVFCANLLGHYVFVQALMPLLWRKKEGGDQEQGRVIWVSTLEAYAKYFDGLDLQGFRSSNAYESSKRLTDLLVLTANQKENAWAQEYLALPATPSSLKSSTGNSNNAPTKTGRSARHIDKENNSVPPKMYLSHPGICVTDILVIHTILVYFQIFTFYICRIFGGSRWHNISREKGVTSMVWLALEEQRTLDDMGAESVKWGSAVDRWGREVVLQTDVDEAGSKRFETLAEKCWMEMEELRVQWDDRLNQAGLL